MMQKASNPLTTVTELSAAVMNDLAPEVSVLMPVNQDHPFLQQAIDSVLTQTEENLELLLLIDGINKDLAISLRQRLKDPRVRVIYSPIPSLAFSLNIGLSHARSEYIARMDSDDICVAHRLQTQLSFMKCNPGITVVASRLSVIDESNREIRLSKFKQRSPEQLKKFLAWRCILPHPSVMFRKDKIIQIGGYLYGAYSEDYDLWLRLRRLPETGFALQNEVLLRYRVHANQATNGRRARLLLSFNLGLKMRELFYTGDWRYLGGMFSALAEYAYMRVMR
jgi:O86/O127-antigen biosynthesis beta-1,3-galactosyltransferase